MKFQSRFIFFLSILAALSCSRKTTVTNMSESHYIINKDEIDSAVYKAVNPYKQSYNEQMNKVLAVSSDAFVKADPESTLGNLFCDAVLYETKLLLGKDSVMVDASVFNKGGLRNSLPKGNITTGNIFELMPFDNELVMLRMSGAQVEDMLAKVAEKGGIPVGGIRMHIDNGKAINVQINGKPFDKNREYWIVTSDYLANGGDNYVFFKNALERKMMNVLLRDVIINYCNHITQQNKTLKPYLDGRVSISK